MPNNKRRKTKLAPFAAKSTVNVIIETPRGKRNKFSFDEKLGRFRLKKVLPAGAAFPYDFGFIPGTKAEDGDPLDVLVLMDESAFPGCLVEARLAGVIEAEQAEGGKAIRNDRIVAVATAAHDYRHIKTLNDLNPQLLSELEHFFQSYNAAEGREFRPLGKKGPPTAVRLIKQAMKMRKHKAAKSRPK
jgi:inorganic pyrophosphatase